MNRFILAVSLLTTCLHSAHATHPNGASGPDIPLWPTPAQVPLGTLGKAPLTPETAPRLTPYLAPKDKATGAAVLVIPGGGYGGVAIEHEGYSTALYFQSIGIHAFALHYRVAREGHSYPAPMLDGKRALRLLRSKAAAYGIDPQRLGVMGSSAGGHLASHLATQPGPSEHDLGDPIDLQQARPNFLILAYPVITMGEHTHGGSRKNLMADRAQDDAFATYLSNELHVDAQTPPTFIFHTQEDHAVPVENALLFYQALRQHQVPASMHLFQRGVHGVGMTQIDPGLDQWPNILTNWLKQQEILATAKKMPNLKGQVTHQGQAIGWGSIAFIHENPNLPVISTRISRGKYQFKPDEPKPYQGKNNIIIRMSQASAMGQPLVHGHYQTEAGEVELSAKEKTFSVDVK